MGSAWSDDGLAAVILYKHPKNTTVALEVLRRHANGWATVCWWNIGDCHDPWPMHLYEHLRLDWTEWEFYANLGDD